MIYNLLLSSEIPGCRDVARHRVYYLWQQMSRGKWYRDVKPFDSAVKLLGEYQEDFLSSTFSHGEHRALVIVSRRVLELVRSTVKEVALDATYGTNSEGMDLYTLMGVVDGTGISLAYMLIGRIGPATQASPHTVFLEQFLCTVRDSFDINPDFVHIDKDLAEVAAIQTTWQYASIQLCLWHCLRAIDRRLDNQKDSVVQSGYNAEEACSLVDGVEACWGSLPYRRPLSHAQGHCQCASRGHNLTDRGPIERLSQQEKTWVKSLFMEHFNAHSFFPFNGSRRSGATIYKDCIRETYRWCYDRNYYRLWAYLYSNWYRPDRWSWWARSANETKLSVLRSTMIVESHWRKLKHSYLRNMNRPRLDIVVWILLNRTIPDAYHRASKLLVGGIDTYSSAAGWRSQFKQSWKEEADKSVNMDRLEEYSTDPVSWICGCKAFLQSRFLLCKHLVHCCDPSLVDRDFFLHLRRAHSPPFLLHHKSILLSQYRIAMHNEPRGSVSSLSQFEGQSWDPQDSQETPDEPLRSHELAEDPEESNERIELANYASVLREVADACDSQHAIGNDKFLEKVYDHRGVGPVMQELVEELRRRKRQRTMPRTWDYNHPNMLYYK